MQITIDLNDILSGECGPEETLEQSICRQVTAAIEEKIANRVNKAVDEKLKIVVGQVSTEAITTRINAICEDLLAKPYVPVDSYGRKGSETTLLEQLHSHLVKECTFQGMKSSYDQNAYTKAVVAAADKKIAEFKVEFAKAVDDGFVARAITHATEELKRKLKIT